MKQKQAPKNKKAVPDSEIKNTGLPDLSQRVVYGIFLSLSLFLTGLLYASSLRVAASPVATVSIPNRQEIFEKKMNGIVAKHPIEKMTPYIAKYNKTTAAFLVGIAKKESNWGKRVPRDDNGDDCYNYWGYRGAGSRGIAMGHGCFGSPEEAVTTVGNRIDTFVHEYEFDTPDELIVWKCGWSCDGHSSKSVKKWIADVGIYYRKVKE